jgi:hypothetical protein
MPRSDWSRAVALGCVFPRRQRQTLPPRSGYLSCRDSGYVTSGLPELRAENKAAAVRATKRRPSPTSGSARGHQGLGSRAAGVGMAFNLIESAQAR